MAVKEDPSKWFLDHSEGAHVLRAANREKGNTLSVGDVNERDLDGFVVAPHPPLAHPPTSPEPKG